MKFTSGSLQKISNDYYNLVLKNNNKFVYKATIPNKDAIELINKYNGKIKILS